MHCQVRSADRTFYIGEATMIVARSSRGQFAIMDDHAPLLATLREGALRVKTTDGERVFACLGGTLQVTGDSDVSVLVIDASPVEEIDLDEVRHSLDQLDQRHSDDVAPELDRRRTRLTTLLRVKEQHG
jgi:F-type H+-transporting ATPase subunit epsilon